MIQANVVEVKRPKRPRLYCATQRTGKGPEWFTVAMVPDAARLHTLLARDRSYEELQFIIPGEDDVLTEEKVRGMAMDRASQIITTTNGMVPMFHQDVTNILVAFAKELGVLK